MSPLNWVRQDIDTYKAGDAMPFSPSFVFSPDGQTIGFSSGGDIYLSNDSGQTWETYTGLKDAGYSVGLVALTNTSIMYVAGNYTFYRHDKSTGQTVMIKDTSGYYSGGGSLASSETGQYVSMSVVSGYNYSLANYYISNDYGNTWSNPFSFYNAWDKSMIKQMNNTGQYQAVFTTNEYVVTIGNLNHGHNCVRISNDYGVSWTKVLDLTDTDIPNYYMIEKGGFVANYNNSTMCVAYTTGTFPNLMLKCHVTHDYGSTWHATTIDANTRVNYGRYSIDYSGQYITWIGSDYDINSNAVTVSQDYGETWTRVYPPANLNVAYIRPTGHEVWGSFANYTAGITTDWFSSWTSINPFAGQTIVGAWLTKASADGTKFLVAQYNGGYVYIGNGNSEWAKANIAGGISLYVESCAISGNGQYMLVGEWRGRLFLSSDGGAIWSEIRPSKVDEDLNWFTVSINYSGQYMLAGDYRNDNLYFSNDYGATWTLVSAGVGYAEASCINDSGSVLVAAGYAGGIFISTDFGSSWTERYLSDTYWNFTSLSCTALGDTIYLTTESNVARSSDYGLSWTTIATNDNGSNYSVDCSDNDEIVLFANIIDGLKSSTDKVSWTFELPTMRDVSSDATGTRIICGQYNGYVYMSGAAAPINLDDKYAKLGHNHPYAPPADYMINGHTIYPLDIRPTGSYYSSAGEIGVGNGIPHSLRLANGGVLTLTVRGGIVTYIG